MIFRCTIAQSVSGEHFIYQGDVLAKDRVEARALCVQAAVDAGLQTHEAYEVTMIAIGPQAGEGSISPPITVDRADA